MKLFCFAGPNGSGKTTAYNKIKFLYEDVEWVNADVIAMSPSLQHITDPFDRNLKAAQLAETIREQYLEEKKDFAFETVLSTDRNLKFLQKAKEQGAKVFTFYILTRDKEINVQRVAKRVGEGGHDVPVDKIRSRYDKCMELLPEILATSDIATVLDTTIADKTNLLLHKDNDHHLIFSENYEEDEFMMKNLIGKLPVGKCTFLQPHKNLGPYFKTMKNELEI